MVKRGKVDTSGQNTNDLVDTPDNIARFMVSQFPLTGTILEPCRGNDAIYKYLPAGSDWCEIRRGRDFFNYQTKVDWIISNPPYSNFENFMDHAFEVAENVVFLIPIAKVVSSWRRMYKVSQYGGLKSLFVIPSRRVGLPFGFPSGIHHFKRGYNEGTKITCLGLKDLDHALENNASVAQW